MPERLYIMMVELFAVFRVDDLFSHARVTVDTMAFFYKGGKR
jgi:hypothetical protein